jgi:hypothetical protein
MVLRLYKRVDTSLLRNKMYNHIISRLHIKYTSSGTSLCRKLRPCSPCFLYSYAPTHPIADSPKSRVTSRKSAPCDACNSTRETLQGRSLLLLLAEVGKNIFVLLFIFIVIIYLFKNGNMSIARTAKYQLFEILFVFGGVHSGGGKAPNWGYKTRETPTNCGGVRSGEATCSCGQSSRIHQRTEVGSSLMVIVLPTEVLIHRSEPYER